LSNQLSRDHEILARHLIQILLGSAGLSSASEHVRERLGVADSAVLAQAVVEIV
jgi:hypothetical protein